MFFFGDLLGLPLADLPDLRDDFGEPHSSSSLSLMSGLYSAGSGVTRSSEFEELCSFSLERDLEGRAYGLISLEGEGDIGEDRGILSEFCQSQLSFTNANDCFTTFHNML